MQDLALRAVIVAIAIRRPPPGCLHHTDRGSQGGFNRSSQHPEFRGVDDDRKTEVGALDGTQIILARSTASLAA